MSIRWKFFILISLLSTTALLVIFGVYTYLDSRNLFREAVRLGKLKTEGLVVILRDPLYYGDYDLVIRLLKNLHITNVKDVIVVDVKGSVVATKRRGFVLFEEYESFEDIKGLKKVRIEKREGEIVFSAPVSLGEEILGYIVLLYDSSFITESVKNNLKLYSLTLAGSLVVFYVLAFALSSYIHGYIKVANNLLEDISRGILDIPEPPRTGDEFETLFRGIKRTADRLKELIVSRDFYLAVINSLKEGLIVLDSNLRIVDMNRATYMLCSISKEHVKGKHIKDVMPCLYEELIGLTERQGVDRFRITTPEGIYLDVKATYYKNFLILTLEDVTDQVIYEKRLKEMAEKDPLTGVYNRRVIDNLLRNLVEKFKKEKRPFSVILFDLDHFKRINDTYGHDVGDQVLREVTEVASSCIRSSDILGRWGGEEFIIILPRTDVEVAEKVAERIRLSLERRKMGEVGRVTASFGVVQVREGDSVESLIKRADEALYRAKKEGRNRVMVG